MKLNHIILALTLSLTFASTSVFANYDNLKCTNFEASSKDEILKRIKRVNLESKNREDIIKIRKELAGDAIRTSGKAKLAWLVGVIPVTLHRVASALSYQFLELPKAIAYGSISFSPAIYYHYELGYVGLRDTLKPDVDARSLITLPDDAQIKLKKNQNIEIINNSISPICYLNYLRFELDNTEKLVFENELNGSVLNTIKDHLLAGTVAADGVSKLYEISVLRQYIDIAEVQLLKTLL